MTQLGLIINYTYPTTYGAKCNNTGNLDENERFMVRNFPQQEMMRDEKQKKNNRGFMGARYC